MRKRKICLITGSRAEYGLLKPLIDELNNDGNIILQILVTGMHLSPEFGLTYKDIENEDLHKNEKVEILLSSDTPVGIAKSMGLGMISFSEAYQRLSPDLIIGLGDRFELFSAVSAALVARIPVAHLYGGETTVGAYDEAFRHSITKMSHVHFTSTDIYRMRVIQLGENPKYVFSVGALGLDNIKKMKLLTKGELEKSINFRLDKPFFVVTFHPVTLDNNSSEFQMKELFLALDNHRAYNIVFTKPNADNDGRVIINMIDEYVKLNNDRAVAFTSLGQLRYLSILKYAAMMVGNSSSGIIEMPYFRKPVINIGDRQRGRISPQCVINCEPERESIFNAIKKGLQKEFVDSIKNQLYPYGDGTAAVKIKKELLKIDYQSLIKKEFYDIDFKMK